MSSASITFNQTALQNRGHEALQTMKKYLPFILMGLLALLAFIGFSHAAGTLDANAEGQALAAAYNKVNDLTGGYGKALVISIGFIVTVFAILASQATGPVLKFIGIAIFLSMGLGAALTLAGATI